MPLVPDRSDGATHPDRRSSARQPRSARRARDYAQCLRLDWTARPPPLRFGEVRLGEGGLRQFHLNKSRSMSSGDAASLSSSPLKGIGHTSLPMPATFIPSFSLPLVGIGNSLADLPTAGGDAGSLPLMGIGNLRLLLVVHQHVVLITPHGDRKRRGPIGATAPSLHLITPHGDRKRYRRWLDEVDDVSLPLMGIGNPCCAPECVIATVSHYPSWGSETCVMPAPPLQPSSSHYPSWGSETR